MVNALTPCKEDLQNKWAQADKFSAPLFVPAFVRLEWVVEAAMLPRLSMVGSSVVLLPPAGKSHEIFLGRLAGVCQMMGA
jgi:hypothetical protein